MNAFPGPRAHLRRGSRQGGCAGGPRAGVGSGVHPQGCARERESRLPKLGAWENLGPGLTEKRRGKEAGQEEGAADAGRGAGRGGRWVPPVSPPRPAPPRPACRGRATLPARAVRPRLAAGRAGPARGEAAAAAPGHRARSLRSWAGQVRGQDVGRPW